MKKENEMLGGCEKLIRSNSKEKKLKKNWWLVTINSNSNNDKSGK